MPLIKQINAEPIPGYRLLHQLGKGGFAEVWKCEAPGGFVKALKFVYGSLDAFGGASVQAEQELRALDWIKVVRHPFILSTERVEIINGELIIVMELADKNLENRLHECQAIGLTGIPRDELLAYMRDAAEALDLMNIHHDLQHLDIKPRNLFLVGNRLKVADFGLVQCIEELAITNPETGLPGKFTPHYTAPELFHGSISRFCDQYSLAVTYQELLTNTRPFQGTNPRRLAMQHSNDKPDLTGIPEKERPVLTRALAKDPKDRYPSCLAFVRALISQQNESSTSPSLPTHGDASTGTPLPPALRMTDTMEDLFLSAVLPNPSHGSRSGEVLIPQKLAELATENVELRRVLSQTREELQIANDRVEVESEWQQKYDNLVAGKFDLLRKRLGDALGSQECLAEPTHEEILAIAHELDRQRTQVRREEKELRSQIRIEEVRICRERSQLTRQQADWLRLHPHGSSPNRPVVASPTAPATSPVPDSIPAPNRKPAPGPSPEQSKELERLRSEAQSQRKELTEQQRHLTEQRQQLKADEESLKHQIKLQELQLARERAELAKQHKEFGCLRDEWERKQKDLKAKLDSMTAAEMELAQKLAPLAHLRDTIEQVLSAQKSGVLSGDSITVEHSNGSLQERR